MPLSEHPVKEIVLPLAVVMGLVGNALFIGISWGRVTQRLDIMDQKQDAQSSVIDSHSKSIQDVKDRVHDLERDMKENERRFMLLDDYTRGRIDKYPYKAPGPSRW
jgi:hypothetical protein